MPEINLPADYRGKVYIGFLNEDGLCRVWVKQPGEPEGSEGYPLPLKRDVRDHSTGFSWGYGGSGPAQLALAILCDALPTGDRERAERLYQRFKHRVIAGLPQGAKWYMTYDRLMQTVAKLEDELGGEEEVGEL